jgi:hypothetical protein
VYFHSPLYSSRRVAAAVLPRRACPHLTAQTCHGLLRVLPMSDRSASDEEEEDVPSQVEPKPKLWRAAVVQRYFSWLLEEEESSQVQTQGALVTS